jgi:hypothetical protein
LGFFRRQPLNRWQFCERAVKLGRLCPFIESPAMERLVLNFMMLGEGAIVATSLLVMGLGVLAAALTLTVRARLRRVTYLLAIAALNMAFVAVQFGYAFVPEAAEAGMFAALVIAVLACSAPYGAAVYLASAARSNDIRGNRRLAWLGLVPVLNLYLVFKAGETATNPDRVRRSAFGRLVADPVLVMVAVFGFALVKDLDKALESGNALSPEEEIAMTALYVRTRTVEELFATMAQELGALLPSRLNEITSLRAIEADQKTLRFTYVLDEGASEELFGQKQMVLERACSAEEFAHALALGGHLSYHYESAQGDVVEEFELTQRDCQV